MVKSAVRVMQILKMVGSSRIGLKHHEIARTLNIPKGSLSLLLADLISEEFLYFDETDGRYKIGFQVLALAGRYLDGMDIIEMSRPVFKELIASTNESGGLAMRMGTNVVIVWKQSAPQLIKLEFEIGEAFPLYSTAAGKVILAHCDDEEIDQYLSSVELVPVTSKTITDPKKLRQELKNIRTQALAYSFEEWQEGKIAMAAPVFKNDGQIVAAIAQPIPSMRFNNKKKEIIEQSLKKASKDLSRKLGFVI
jgi:DNA-binding IclR family transcriptional regulator